MTEPKDIDPKEFNRRAEKLAKAQVKLEDARAVHVQASKDQTKASEEYFAIHREFWDWISGEAQRIHGKGEE